MIKGWLRQLRIVTGITAEHIRSTILATADADDGTEVYRQCCGHNPEFEYILRAPAIQAAIAVLLKCSVKRGCIGCVATIASGRAVSQ